MAPSRMHAGQVDTDADLVRRLLGEQFPAWAGLPVTPVASFGTDHDIYRLGDDLAVRLPRVAYAVGQLDLEARWLPVLAPQLPVAVPAPVGIGVPGEGYPLRWSVVSWVPGRDAADGRGDAEQVAVDLASFVRALQTIPTAGAPPRRTGARGAPLAELDASVRRALDELDDRVDQRAVRRAWEEALAAPASEAAIWVHGDLLPGNLLVAGGRLTGVIDFGALGVGDPAVELLAAWNVFTGAARERYRRDLDVDDAGWLRGRGWAIAQAVIALPYYWETNQGMVRQGRRALAELLGDAGQ
jgi:aminoglycoside phosphotransferase (APT) family kinase protein